MATTHEFPIGDVSASSPNITGGNQELTVSSSGLTAIDDNESVSGDAGGESVWTVGTLRYTRNGLIVLFAFLLMGDFAWSARERSIGPMAQWYLKHLGISNVWFALVISSLPSMLALVVGPVVSYRSDRYRSPRGRRIPFIGMTTTLAVIGMCGIALCPLSGPWLSRLLGQRSPGVAACSIILFAIFWLIYEFATIAAQSVFNALINDVVPNALVGRFFGMFRVVSLADGIIFNLYLMGKVEQHFVLMMLTISVIYGVFMTLLCWKIKEGHYPPPPVALRDGNVAANFIQSVRQFLRECFGHPYFIVLFAFNAVAGLAFTPVNTFAIPQAQSVNVSLEQLGYLYVIMFIGSFVSAYPVGWLADRFHPIRVVMVSLVLYTLAMAWGASASGNAAGFKLVFVLHGLIGGVYNTGIASIGQRLYPRSRFAQFASAAAMVWHMMNFVIGPLVGQIIDWHSGDYRISYVVASALSVLALILGAVVYRDFQKLGGDRNYQSPLVDEEVACPV